MYSLLFVIITPVIFLSMSTDSPLLLWVILELNGVVLVLVGAYSLRTLTALIKLVFIQAVSANIILAGVLINMPVLSVGLFLNLGLPPLHLWIEEIFSSADWIFLGFQISIINLVPIIYLCISVSSQAIIWTGILTTLYSIAINQHNPNVQFFYIGVSSLLWVCCSICLSSALWIPYLLYNSLFLLAIANLISEGSPWSSVFVAGLLLGVVGFPPLFGFFLNLKLLMLISSWGFTLMFILMVMGSLIILYVWGLYSSTIFIAGWSASYSSNVHLPPTAILSALLVGLVPWWLYW